MVCMFYESRTSARAYSGEAQTVHKIQQQVVLHLTRFARKSGYTNSRQYLLEIVHSRSSWGRCGKLIPSILANLSTLTCPILGDQRPRWLLGFIS